MEVVVAWVAWRPRSHTGAYLVVNVGQRVHQHAVAPCDGLCHNVRPAIMHRVGIRRVEVRCAAGCHLVCGGALLTCFLELLRPHPSFLHCLASSPLSNAASRFSLSSPFLNHPCPPSASPLPFCRLLPLPLPLLPTPRHPSPPRPPRRCLSSLSPPLVVVAPTVGVTIAQVKTTPGGTRRFTGETQPSFDAVCR